jgi:DNA helicase-2/ATP-dependent DNA helicase PcrA
MVHLNTSSDYQEQVYIEELDKLEDVVWYIAERHVKLEGENPTAWASRTAQEIKEILKRHSDTLYAGLDRPYFGRIDFRRVSGSDSTPDTDGSESGQTETPTERIYIGINMPAVDTAATEVVSWTAPVSELWYNPNYEDTGWTAPKGHIQATVDLKRHIKIRDGELEDVSEMFRRQLPAADYQRVDMLTEALSEPGDESGHLQIIVETIEPEQYQNIANVSDKVLIVQGAAGSGKSEIGLHRIAYLLSPFNGIPEAERPTPSTTLFVGPSQAFLEYASDILPGLGVAENVEQTKFSDWLVSRLSETVKIRPRIWNDLLNNGEMRRFNEEAETFKGSLAMADAIERHVKGIVNETRRRIKRLPSLVDERDSRIRITKDEINRTANQALRGVNNGIGLNRGRDDFIVQITNLAYNRGQGASRFRNVRPYQIREQSQGQLVDPWCDAQWQRLDFKEEYVSLLSDSEDMSKQAKGSLTLENAREMAESARRSLVEGFDDSDLGALAYLDHLLNGTIQNRYRHIVVDEAQDISPIEFKLLSEASSNNWFTVLGDTVQRLTPYRGIRTWKRDLMRVFGLSDIEVQPARRSYRSNKQITVFNNRILRTFDKNIDAPIPFERDGHRVEYHRHRTASDMYKRVTEDIDRIRSLDGLENAIIAVLARDQRNLNEFQKFCGESGVDGITLIGQERYINSQTVLARIPDVKGLEYDAVIVMGVNESFTDTTFNKKLLYIATTRAKHYLGIHWSGQQSPILKSIYSGGVNLNDFTRPNGLTSKRR